MFLCGLFLAPLPASGMFGRATTQWPVSGFFPTEAGDPGLAAVSSAVRLVMAPSVTQTNEIQWREELANLCPSGFAYIDNYIEIADALRTILADRQWQKKLEDLEVGRSRSSGRSTVGSLVVVSVFGLILVVGHGLRISFSVGQPL